MNETSRWLPREIFIVSMQFGLVASRFSDRLVGDQFLSL